MTKKREVNKEIHYKKIINKQKNIIKDLKKKASRGSKVQDRYEDLEEELLIQLEDQEISYNNVNVCPSCIKGKLEIIDLKVRKMIVCSSCDYREVKK